MSPISRPGIPWKAYCRQVSGLSGPVRWAWAAARDYNGKWQATRLSVRAPALVDPVVYRYRGVVLGVEELAPRAAAARPRNGLVVPKAVVGERLSFEVPNEAQPQWLTTGPEGFTLAHGGWPRSAMSINLATDALIDEPLHAAGAPFFPSVTAALSEVVFEAPVPPINALRTVGGVVVLERIDARLTTLTIDDTTVAAGVELTDQTQPWTVRARWRSEASQVAWDGIDETVAASRNVVVDVGAIPRDMLIALIDPDHEIVDQRGWQGGQAPTPEGPQSLEARVRRWLLEGEHDQLEYMRELSKPDTRRRFAEAVAAFANGSGGTVLIGVDDEGNLIGYGSPKAADQVTQIVTNTVDEPPSIRVESITIDGKPIQVVHVPASSAVSRPHLVDRRVLVRAGATNRRAHPREVAALAAVAAEPEATSRSPWGSDHRPGGRGPRPVAAPGRLSGCAHGARIVRDPRRTSHISRNKGTSA